MNDSFKQNSKYPGDDYYYIICDICGRKIRRKNAHVSGISINGSKNLLVCENDLDALNEQDLVRAKADRIALPGRQIRSETTNQFLQADITWRDL